MSYGRIEVDEDAFRRDWAAGLTLAEMAAVYGMSTSTVSTCSVRLGCPSRQPGRRLGSGTNGSPTVLSAGEWIRDDRGVMRWHERARRAG